MVRQFSNLLLPKTYLQKKILSKVLLKDKTAVITGSNRGIGLKILEIFSQNGADVIACSRNVDKNFLNKIND